MRARQSATRALIAITLLAGASVAGSGCGSAVTPKAASPRIDVVTGLYPLAQAVEQIGSGAVTVTDLVPEGTDPTTYSLTHSQLATVRDAAVVVEVGGGFQPSFEGAAAGAKNVVNLRTALATEDPYIWLTPDLMRRAVSAIAATLERSDPNAAGRFRDGAQAFEEEITSTGIDFESTLSACPRHTIVTPDRAFAGMARSYGLIDQTVGTDPQPTSAAVTAEATAARSAGTTTAFSEPWVPDQALEAVAHAAGLKVRSLDPLTGPPPQGWPRQATYINLMEANLGALNSALGCPNAGTGV